MRGGGGQPVFLVRSNRNNGARPIERAHIEILAGRWRPKIDAIDTGCIQRHMRISDNWAVVDVVAISIRIDPLDTEGAGRSGLKLRKTRDRPVTTDCTEEGIGRAVFGTKPSGRPYVIDREVVTEIKGGRSPISPASTRRQVGGIRGGRAEE